MTSIHPEQPPPAPARTAPWRGLLRAGLWGAVGITAGLMAWRLAQDPLVRRLSPGSFDLPSLALAAAAIVFSQLLYCSRWHWFLRVVRAPIAWAPAVFTGLVAQLLSAVAVGPAGGDVYRGVVTGRAQAGHRVGIVASILADRVVGLYSLFCVAALAATFTTGDGRWQAVRNAALPVLWGAVLGGGAFMLAGLFLNLGPVLGLVRRVPPLLRIITPLLAAVERFRSSPGVYALGVASGMAGHATNAAALWLVARALRVPHPTLAEHCLISPLAACTMLLPLPMAGIGAVELVMDELYRTAVPDVAGAGLLVAFVGRLLTLAVTAVLAAVMMPLANRAGPEPQRTR